MRSAKVWVPLAILLALVIGASAQAGGKGAVKVGLYEGHVYSVGTDERVYAESPLEQVGFVIFNPTANDTMSITVKVEGGAANTEFEVLVVAKPDWDAATQDYTLTTNGKGNGALHILRAIPAKFVDSGSALVKIQLRSPDNSAAYATESRTGTFTNPPQGEISRHTIELK